MESQGEWEPGVVRMDVECVESMAQDENPEQEMLVVQEHELPQLNPEPEMGAAATVAYDTSPPPLRQNPPILVEPSALDRILQVITANTQQMNEMKTKMDTNTQQMKNEMKANLKEEMKELRGETQNMGRSLQARMKAIIGECVMAMPRVGANELGGGATVVRPAVEAGEDKIIREMCWARVVTEKVTVTEREKLNGVTKTCETRHEVTTQEIIVETREIEGELDGVSDEHTHTDVVEDNGGELAERVGTRCEQLDSLLREQRETLCPLEEDHDQVGSVVLCEVEGTGAVDRCTPRLGEKRPRNPLWEHESPVWLSRCVWCKV
uniref:Uncharacterized protein n=1 Tax=Eptatretus burgeri TaxID=7764 RepID=A0A8C4PWU0_EPTBU